MPPRKPLAPVTKPADCWDWITPEDVLRIALASFYAACRRTELLPEDGSPWVDADGIAYSDRFGLPVEISWQFEHRIAEFAHARGIGNFLDQVRELIDDERHIKNRSPWKPHASILRTDLDIHCRANSMILRCSHTAP